jgi:hypothetical protein
LQRQGLFGSNEDKLSEYINTIFGQIQKESKGLLILSLDSIANVKMVTSNSADPEDEEENELPVTREHWRHRGADYQIQN